MDAVPPNPDATPRRGRTPKLTDELALALAQSILDGNFRYVAAQQHSVGKRTFQRWMKTGRDFPEGLYGTFRRLVIESEAEAERMAVRAIYRAGKEDDPKYLAWWLERKFPQRWGKYRGELGEMKRRIRELEELLERAITDREAEGPS